MRRQSTSEDHFGSNTSYSQLVSRFIPHFHLLTPLKICKRNRETVSDPCESCAFLFFLPSLHSLLSNLVCSSSKDSELPSYFEVSLLIPSRAHLVSLIQFEFLRSLPLRSSICASLHSLPSYKKRSSLISRSQTSTPSASFRNLSFISLDHSSIVPSNFTSIPGRELRRMLRDICG